MSEQVESQTEENTDISDSDLLVYQFRIQTELVESIVSSVEALSLVRLNLEDSESEDGTGNAMADYLDNAISIATNSALLGIALRKEDSDKALNLTIRREPFEQIIAGTKAVEYREIKEYYINRLALYYDVGERAIAPFRMTLRNGYDKGVPEITVNVTEVTMAGGLFELHVSDITEHKNLTPAQLQMLAARTN